MSIFMMLALAGKRQLVTFTRTFTANGTWPCPAGVTKADISGYGARGTNEVQGVASIREVTTIYATRRSDGGQDVFTSSRRVVYTSQTGYCEPENITPSDPVYSSNQTCYGYDQYSAGSTTPATTGASATGLGKVFPGSYRNTTPAVTSFANVPVTPSANYSIVVPSGGSITITWKA